MIELLCQALTCLPVAGLSYRCCGIYRAQVDHWPFGEVDVFSNVCLSLLARPRFMMPLAKTLQHSLKPQRSHFDFALWTHLSAWKCTS